MTRPAEQINKQQKYKFEFYPCFGASYSFSSLFYTEAEMIAAANAVADYTLMLHKIGLMQDFSNVLICYEFDEETGEWEQMERD